MEREPLNDEAEAYWAKHRPTCADCGESVTGVMWNGGRCWDCHDARCLYPLGDWDLPPQGFDPAYAGESWD